LTPTSGSAFIRRASRRHRRSTCRLLVANTTHRLFTDGPADASERAKAYWRRDPTVEAFRAREPGVHTSLSPHRPGLWLGFEARGGQAHLESFDTSEWLARHGAAVAR
jgi:hypothetical protein